MKTSTYEGKHGIQRRVWVQLDDSDFANDLALLFYAHQQMLVKTPSVVAAAEAVGPNILKVETKILKYSTGNTNTIKLRGGTLEEVETFTHLDSIIDEQEGSDADLKARIG
ncbi:unnamed protein product [Schistosoma curassoni]|uniref:BTB domain-containing protein n=1 Tax=Schistosoma curassoni TaxID=6186 RepID=A0A183JTS9_9TREM|nr:unnamed protein product [Schistosoma curassoni]